jgi:hypothetical protein
MGDFLAPLWAGVDDESISRLGKTLLLGYVLGREQDVTQQ